jgi:hypothetical protein
MRQRSRFLVFMLVSESERAPAKPADDFPQILETGNRVARIFLSSLPPPHMWGGGKDLKNMQATVSSFQNLGEIICWLCKGPLRLTAHHVHLKVSTTTTLPTIRKKKVTHQDVSAFVAHATLHWPGQLTELPVICPAVALLGKTAADMKTALDNHFATAFRGLTTLAQMLNILVLVFVTDAHKANRLLFRMYLACATANLLLIHQLCFMHQVSLCVGAVYRPLRVLGYSNANLCEVRPVAAESYIRYVQSSCLVSGFRDFGPPNYRFL